MNLVSMTQKVILLTGATDGIGLETARRLMAQGHHVLVHGRSPAKLKAAFGDEAESYCCDLSHLHEIPRMAQQIKEKHGHLDVILNNAGVLKTPEARTKEGLDTRITVNTIAPYLLTRELMPLLNDQSRVINLSSAAQAPLDMDGVTGDAPYSDDMQAYAQSKLGIVQWTNALARLRSKEGPVLVSVNPASLLGSKMVKEAFGKDGKDLGIGADILVRAALSDEFGRSAHGKYYDNDHQTFADPHPDALDPKKCQRLVETMDEVLNRIGIQ